MLFVVVENQRYGQAEKSFFIIIVVEGEGLEAACSSSAAVGTLLKDSLII